MPIYLMNLEQLKEEKVRIQEVRSTLDPESGADDARDDSLIDLLCFIDELIEQKEAA